MTRASRWQQQRTAHSHRILTLPLNDKTGTGGNNYYQFKKLMVFVAIPQPPLHRPFGLISLGENMSFDYFIPVNRQFSLLLLSSCLAVCLSTFKNSKSFVVFFSGNNDTILQPILQNAWGEGGSYDNDRMALTKPKRDNSNNVAKCHLYIS